MVAYMPYAMARMKFIWGKDAEVFWPERWLGDDGVFTPESPFKFPAFQVIFFMSFLKSTKIWGKKFPEKNSDAFLLKLGIKM